MSVWIIVIFIGLFGIFLGALAFGLSFMENLRKKRVSRAIRVVTDQPAAPVQEQTTILKPRQAELGLDLTKLPFSDPLERSIKRAGMTWTLQRLLVTMVLCACGGGVAGSMIRILPSRLPGVIGFAVMGAYLPIMIVRRNGSKRMREFESQFPDALDFLARSMRAGHAFSVSLESLAEEMPDPMAYEFRQVFNEQNLGMSIETAISNLHTRVPSVDVGFFMSAVLLQKQSGGNLAEILTKLSYIIRERFRLKMRVRSASAHGRMTGMALTLMPMGLIGCLTLITPEYLPTMVADPVGRYLVVGAVLSQGLAHLFIRKIVDIKV